MKALLTLVLLLSLPARLSPADRAVQATLRRAVAGLENQSISARQFERLAPRRNVPTWQRLQQRIHYPQLGAQDLAFVLAYYGVDYRQNLQQLLIPYRLWRRESNPHPETDPQFMHKVDVLESLPNDLVLLYQKHHDTVSLSGLLDLALDGASAEAQEAAISELWQQQPTTLLRLAAGSKTRLGSLEDMVQIDGDDLRVRKQLFADLRRFSRHPDQRVAGAARRLLSMAQRDFARQRR